MKKVFWVLVLLISLGLLRWGWFWMTHSRKYRPPDYSRLTSLLASRQWEQADLETARLVSAIALDATTPENALGNRWFKLSGLIVLEDFPCQELHQIDQLWREASGDRFGFTPQRAIWNVVDRNQYPDPFRFYDAFQEQVGWKSGGRSEAESPIGHFPTYTWMQAIAQTGEPWIEMGGLFYQKLPTCK